MAVSILKRSMVISSPSTNIAQLADGRMLINFATNPSQQASAVKQLVISSTSIAVDLFDGTRKTLTFPT